MTPDFCFFPMIPSTDCLFCIVTIISCQVACQMSVELCNDELRNGKQGTVNFYRKSRKRIEWTFGSYVICGIESLYLTNHAQLARLGIAVCLVYKFILFDLLSVRLPDFGHWSFVRKTTKLPKTQTFDHVRLLVYIDSVVILTLHVFGYISQLCSQR